MSINFGSHWFYDRNLFKDPYTLKNGINIDPFKESHNLINKALDKHKNEFFIKDYKEKYDDPKDPPSWMLFEVLTMGDVVSLFKLINIDHQRKIAIAFNCDRKYLYSWLKSLSHTRNICANHSRLWNKTLTIKPMVDNRKQFINLTDEEINKFQEGKYYSQFILIKFFLDKISANDPCIDDLRKLISQNNNYISAMGFPKSFI